MARIYVSQPVIRVRSEVYTFPPGVITLTLQKKTETTKSMELS